MKATDPGSRAHSASGSGHRKRKHEQDPPRPSRKESSRRDKRRKVSGGDGNRQWVYSPRDLSSYKRRFTVVSYNILGVENVSKHSDLYHQVSPENLNWNRRKKRICKELKRYNPSVLCFQEVDHFDDLAALLRKDGYAGIYKARSGDASDGCAIFWKEEQFALLHEESIEYRKFGLRDNVAQLCVLKATLQSTGSELEKSMASHFPGAQTELDEVGIHVYRSTHCYCKVEKGMTMFNPIMPRPPYASSGLNLYTVQVCRNYSASEDAKPEEAELSSSQTLLVGNIHVLFNPNRGDIKLGQIRLLLERAFTMSQQWGSIPVIICGDFNSVPQSAVHHYLSSPELDILMYDRKKISGQIEFPMRQVSFSTQSGPPRSQFSTPRLMKYRWSDEEICLAGGSRGCTRLKNPLKLLSAYQGVPGCRTTREKDGEPLATSYHTKFMGTVDYIWHSATLVPVGVVETLPVKCLKALGGLPSEKWGSDHLSLVCEFAFVDDANHTNVLHITKQG